MKRALSLWAAAHSAFFGDNCSTRQFNRFFLPDDTVLRDDGAIVRHKLHISNTFTPDCISAYVLFYV